MKVAMARVGIHTGAADVHEALFQDVSFEYIPIPDMCGFDEHSYGNTKGKHSQPLVEYFPQSWQVKMMNQSIHFDPESETFTYGDRTRPKA